MSARASWRTIVYWSAVVALLLYRPLFALGIPFSAFPNASYDDGLFLRLAIQLREGNWLGDYWQMTLCKGPFYPMFVAAVSRLSLPLAIFEQAFYSVIALIAAWAVRPAIGNRWLLLGGFAFMVLNPYSWGPLPDRLTRDPLAGQLALLSIAGVVGLILRRDRSTVDVAIWGALAGAAGAACWMTREEGIWIAGPAVALLVVGALVLLHEQGRRRLGRAAMILLVPTLTGVLLVASVCEKNRRCYGVFAVVDLKATEFQDAYGALLRVGQKHYRHYVPVPTAARQAMYEVSPAFRELQPLLEGEIGRQWMMHRQMPDPQDMQGGWFIWAFRQAAQETAGHTESPPLDLYRRIADEVNAACDAGLIAGGPRRSGLVTPLNPEDVPLLRESLQRNLWAMLLWPEYRGDAFSADDASLGARMVSDLVKMPLTGAGNLNMITGWACAADGPLTLALRRGDGERLKFKPQWLGSSDVAEVLRGFGRDWPTAEQCRFRHPLPQNVTHLLLFRGDREVARVPLRSENRFLLKDNVAVSVDSVTKRPIPVIPVGKRQVQLAISEVVRYSATVFAGVTLAWFALGIATLRRNFLWLCITGAVAGAVVMRAGLLAYVNATTYPVFEQRYVEPTYTVLAFLFFLSGCAVIQHFTRRRLPAPADAPQAVAEQS